MEIYLASKSPRRKELLERMGLEFTVRAVNTNETMDPFRHPSDEVARVSLEKAKAVQPHCMPDDIIISADTIVVCDSLVMGKPHSESEAFSMLRRLSGRDHQVMSGLTVLHGDDCENLTVTTTLRMRTLSDEEIRAYIATGEPMDKAGAYAIQGLAAMFVIGLDGDYYNVMGLPVCPLAMILRKFGVKLLTADLSAPGLEFTLEKAFSRPRQAHPAAGRPSGCRHGPDRRALGHGVGLAHRAGSAHAVSQRVFRADAAGGAVL